MEWLITLVVGFAVLFLPGYLFFKISGAKLETGRLLLFSMALSFTFPLVTAHFLNHFLGIRPLPAYIIGIVSIVMLAFLKKRS